VASSFKFNPPPGWVVPGENWVPPDGWAADPSWPPAPADWVFWIAAPAVEMPPAPPQAERLHPTPPPPLPDRSATSPTVDDGKVADPPALASSDDAPHLQESAELTTLRAEVAELRSQLALQAATGEASSADGIVELDDERVLQEVGVYRYHHPLENSEEFRDRLRALDGEIKETIKRGEAVLASDMFTFNNSLAKGRRMTSDFSKLMLRAYNAEADNCVRSLRAGNVLTAKKRLEASVTAIAKLGAMMEMQINPAYHVLRNQELELTADFLMKVQEEKEAAREERERLREERKAEQELALEREQLDKQRGHYLNALEALQASGDEEGIADLTQKLADVDEAIAQNDYRAANIKAGYVYVISNAGAFGGTWSRSA